MQALLAARGSISARNAAAEVGTLAQRWMRLTTATALLDKAVENYRQADEGPLIKRANQIFISIAGHQPPDDLRSSISTTISPTIHV